MLLAELQLRLGHPADAIGWATYAHHSATHLHGPTQRRSLHALQLLAAAYRHAGHRQRSYHLYRQLAEHLTRIEGPHAHRTLVTHATTALAFTPSATARPPATSSPTPSPPTDANIPGIPPPSRRPNT
ncbi:hypothetical protein [Micromonospora tulbaghiae]|uniref:hypothetical protein n=1 Tax=Micromonospora tulbaghiae TaxID=479978 RepID=UPI0013C41633|nr:hypothetical protein [Micromonospora tulbaghiae]